MMKTKGKIFQIIKWEEKGWFFSNRKYGDTEVDLIHVGSLVTETWLNHYIFGVFRIFLGLDKPVFKYENIVIEAGNGLPVLVERPHEFKIGDVVEVEIKVRMEK